MKKVRKDSASFNHEEIISAYVIHIQSSPDSKMVFLH